VFDYDQGIWMLRTDLHTRLVNRRIPYYD
jgi:hypothetical protein